LASLSITSANARPLPVTLGGQDVAYARARTGTVEVHSLRDGAVLRRFLGSEGGLGDFAAVPAGRVAVLDAEGVVRLFPSLDERPRRLLGHDSFVYGVATDGRGDRLASIAWDGTARLWDRRSGSCLRTIVVNDGPVLGVALSRDGRRLLTLQTESGRGTTACAWDAAGGDALACVDAIGAQDVEMLGDGRVAVAGSEVSLWPSELSEPSWRRGIAASTLAVEPDERGLLVGTLHGAARLDASTGAVTWQLEGEGELKWRPVVVTPDGRLGLVAVEGGLRVLSLGDGSEVARVPVPGRTIQALAFHPGGATLAIGLTDGTLQLWDWPRRERVASWPEHDDYIRDLVFAPDGSCLVTASGDGTLRRLEAG